MAFRRVFVVEVIVRGKPKDHKVRSPRYDTQQEAEEQHALLRDAILNRDPKRVPIWLAVDVHDLVAATVIPLTTGSGSLQLG